MLILGSFPGAASLREKQYYAHPRNGFWRIMGELLGFDPAVSYPEKIAALKRNRVALWDVLTSCSREGSLDSAISRQSMVVNDFESFFENNQSIRTILFNGTLAESLFKKHTAGGAFGRKAELELYRMPSTSPAMAMLTLAQKAGAWSILAEKLRTR